MKKVAYIMWRYVKTNKQNQNFLPSICFTDLSRFTLNNKPNVQSTRYWFQENLRIKLSTKLQTLKQSRFRLIRDILIRCHTWNYWLMTLAIMRCDFSSFSMVWNRCQSLHLPSLPKSLDWLRSNNKVAGKITWFATVWLFFVGHLKMYTKDGFNTKFSGMFVLL